MCSSDFGFSMSATSVSDILIASDTKSSYIYPGRMAKNNYIMSQMFLSESRSSEKLWSDMFFFSKSHYFFCGP